MGTLKNVNTTKFLRITLGLFFIIIGVMGVMTNVDETIFKLNNNNLTLEIIFGIVEIVCGLLILLGLFAFSSFKAISYGSIVALVFWVARIVLTKFVWCFNITNSSFSFNFMPSVSLWLITFSVELIITAALLVIIKKYE